MATAAPVPTPVDMPALRAAIEAAPANGCAAGVTRGWLEKVESELAELARLRANGAAA